MTWSTQGEIKYYIKRHTLSRVRLCTTPLFKSNQFFCNIKICYLVSLHRFETTDTKCSNEILPSHSITAHNATCKLQIDILYRITTFLHSKKKLWLLLNKGVHSLHVEYFLAMFIYVPPKVMSRDNTFVLLPGRSLTRYAKLRVAHASGMSGKFFSPPTSKETANWRSTIKFEIGRDIIPPNYVATYFEFHRDILSVLWLVEIISWHNSIISRHNSIR